MVHITYMNTYLDPYRRIGTSSWASANWIGGTSWPISLAILYHCHFIVNHLLLGYWCKLSIFIRLNHSVTFSVTYVTNSFHHSCHQHRVSNQRPSRLGQGSTNRNRPKILEKSIIGPGPTKQSILGLIGGPFIPDFGLEIGQIGKTLNIEQKWKKVKRDEYNTASLNPLSSCFELIRELKPDWSL